MRSQRVIMAHGSDAWYGSDRALFTVALLLRKRGFEPVVLLTGSSDSRPGPLTQHLRNEGVQVMMIPGSLCSRKSLHAPLRLTIDWIWGSLAIARLARRWRAPVVANTSLIAHLALPSRLVGVPVVVWFREVPDWPMGAQRVARLYSRLASLCVSVSKATEELDVARSARAHSIIVPDEIVEPVFQPPLPQRESGTTAIFVGRLNPKKAPHVALEAVRLLVLRGYDLRLVLVGEVDSDVHQSYADGLRRRADEPPLRGRVSFAGFVDDPGILIAAADVLVNPIPFEPLGHVVFEAFRAGTPVVAAAAGGPLEYIKPRQTGLLFRPNDVESLAGELAWLLDHPEAGPRIAAAALEEMQSIRARSAAAHQLFATRLEDLAHDGRCRR